MKSSVNYGYGVRRKKISELKSERITVQVTMKEKEMLEILAERNGQTVSDHVRINCIHKPYSLLFGGEY